MRQKETIGIKTNRNKYMMEVSRHMIKKEKTPSHYKDGEYSALH